MSWLKTQLFIAWYIVTNLFIAWYIVTNLFIYVAWYIGEKNLQLDDNFYSIMTMIFIA